MTYKYIFLLIIVCLFNVIGSIKASCSNGRTSREFRGAWIATVSNIDWPNSSHVSTVQNQADLKVLLDSLESARINAVIFQVRPTGDALYNSSIEPWSEYLTGSQGTAPSPWWDPLAFVIEECHKRNMELHAWINPYRANIRPSKSGLAANNMALTFPADAHVYGNHLWMDPGSSRVQKRTKDVVRDIVMRYNVDAIHMDDYFYPYPTDQDFPDSSSYEKFKNQGGTMSLSDWRRNNVNSLIQTLYTEIKSIKPHVKFGISPFGIWLSHHPSHIRGSSSFHDLYADSRLWLRQCWVDYLAPQLYWKIDPPAQSFTALADWWSEVDQNPLKRHLYPGLADYRIEQSQWSPEEIIRQVLEVRARWQRQLLGEIHFSANDLQFNVNGLTQRLIDSTYKRPALVPRMPWLTNPSIKAPSTPKVNVTNASLNWRGSDETSVRSWAVYETSGDFCKLEKVLPVGVTSIFVAPGPYVVASVDRLGREVDSLEVIVHDTIVG